MSGNHLSFEKKWKQRFEKFAKNTTDAKIAGWSEGGLEVRKKAFISRWHQSILPYIHKGQLWCDIGCGAGTYVNQLHQYSLNVIGLDYSFPTILKAKQRIHPPAKLLGISDIYALGLKSNTCDGMLCFGVLQALTDHIKSLRECYRVLKRDAFLCVDALNKSCILHFFNIFYRKLRNKPEHLVYLKPKELKAILEILGFEMVSIDYILILPEKLKFFQNFLTSLKVVEVVQKTPILNSLLCHSFMVTVRRGDHGK